MQLFDDFTTGLFDDPAPQPSYDQHAYFLTTISASEINTTTEAHDGRGQLRWADKPTAHVPVIPQPAEAHCELELKDRNTRMELYMLRRRLTRDWAPPGGSRQQQLHALSASLDTPFLARPDAALDTPSLARADATGAYAGLQVRNAGNADLAGGNAGISVSNAGVFAGSNASISVSSADIPATNKGIPADIPAIPASNTRSSSTTSPVIHQVRLRDTFRRKDHFGRSTSPAAASSRLQAPQGGWALVVAVVLGCLLLLDGWLQWTGRPLLLLALLYLVGTKQSIWGDVCKLLAWGGCRSSARAVVSRSLFKSGGGLSVVAKGMWTTTAPMW